MDRKDVKNRQILLDGRSYFVLSASENLSFMKKRKAMSAMAKAPMMHASPRIVMNGDPAPIFSIIIPTSAATSAKIDTCTMKTPDNY